MKKLFYILPIMGFVALSSCALEMNSLDKFLTEAQFNVGKFSYSSSTVAAKNYTDVSFTDVTQTDTRTITATGGVLTDVQKSQTAPSPGIVSFDQYTYTYSYSGDFKFNEDGTFSMDATQTLTSYQHADEITTDPVITFTGVPPTSSHYEGTWVWANTSDPKTYLTIEGLGTFAVNTAEKKDGKMDLDKVNNQVDVTNGFDGVGDYITTTITHETTTYELQK